MDDRATREAAADLIERGIDVLHEKGWCQGYLQNEAGQVCLAGALRTAAGHGSIWAGTLADRPAELDIAWRAVDRESGDHVALSIFNDHPSTTVEDVVLTMKRAAHSLREVTA